MRYFPKEKAVLTLVVSSLILLAFALLMPTETITNVSAVYPNRVGVYWDSDCTDPVLEILWGNLTPGSSKSIIVYIHNEVEEPTYLIMSTTNWNPSNALEYMSISWDYGRQRMNSGEVLQITLTLSVSRYIEGISSFSFDILITGSQRLPGDVDGDGKVDVMDQRLMQLAMFTVPGYPSWNPNADIDGDGDVDIIDQRKQQDYMFKIW